MKGEFKYCKKINNLEDTLLFCHSDYYCYSTKVQISGIYPLAMPYRTGAYWDDIAYLGLMTQNNGNLTLLGAGLLSFMPLMTSLLSKRLEVTCIDINEDILNVAKGLQQENSNNILKEISYICEDVQRLPLGFFSKANSLFVDIYDEFEISSISIGSNFLEKIKKELQPNAIVGMNVNDSDFSIELECSSRLFYEKIKQYWSNVLLARRATSTTIFFSTDVSVLEMKNRLLCVNLNSDQDYFFVEDGKNLFQGNSSKLFLNKELLKFEKNFKDSVLRKDSLIYSVVNDLKSLSPLDIVKLLKKGKKIE